VTCTEFLALLDDLIDDSVTPEVRADLQQHLRGCDHCEVTLSTTRKPSRSTDRTRFTICPPGSASGCTRPSWRDARRAASPAFKI